MGSSPPPFMPSSPAKKTNVVIWVIVGILGIGCLGLIGVGFWGFSVVKNELGPMVQCAVGFNMAGKAIKAYAADHGGVLPKAASWQDDVRPYYVKEMAKEKDNPFGEMPADGMWGCSFKGTSTGLAYNSDIAGKKLADIKDPNTTALVFEIEKPSLNAHESYKPRDKASGPKIFGDARGWIVVNVSGNDLQFKAGKDSSLGPIEIKTKMSSGSN